MKRIIQLLEQKNHYLEKFYSLNEQEILNFSQGSFDNLEAFYKTREEILNMIRYVDHQLNHSDFEKTNPISTEIRIEVKENLAIKDEYVTRILAQDLEILSCIESAKSNIIRELQDVRRTKSVMNRYKSGPGGSGRLNEEA